MKVKNKRLFAGYYTKYDNSLIYVVTVVTDVDTSVESVIFYERLVNGGFPLCYNNI